MAALLVPDAAASGCAPAAGLRQVRRRTLAVLAATQMLGGAGLSTTAAVGGLDAARLSGSAAVGGLAPTAAALGAALVGLPLARTAERAGRRIGLRQGYLTATAGAAVASVAVAAGSWRLLIAAAVLIGAATATTLAARFAATDLVAPGQRGRALSVVMWATTTGAVSGPNMAEPARRLASLVGAAPGTGPYLMCAVLFGAAALGVQVGLRPDPLLVARSLRAAPVPEAPALRPADGAPALRAPALATASLVVAQAVMVALMSMAPLHLAHGGAGLHVIGLAISVHVGSMYALSPVFGWLSDRVGRRTVLGLGAGLLVASALLASTAAPHAALLLSAALAGLGVGWSAVLVSGSALLIDAVHAADRARVQGRTDAVMNLSGALGGGVAGAIVAATSYSSLCALAAVLPASVLVAVAVRAPGRPRATRAAS